MLHEVDQVFVSLDLQEVRVLEGRGRLRLGRDFDLTRDFAALEVKDVDYAA